MGPGRRLGAGRRNRPRVAPADTAIGPIFRDATGLSSTGRWIDEELTCSTGRAPVRVNANAAIFAMPAVVMRTTSRKLAAGVAGVPAATSELLPAAKRSRWTTEPRAIAQPIQG